ncbi:MAG: SpoIVB peptidase [Clostridia bacterium]|nr:SpoIVB peptidase [Clostridia bacterium]
MTNKYMKKAVALMIALILSLTPISANAAARVCPGGFPFGVKFYTDGVIVSSLEEVSADGGAVMPALNAGLKLKDIITEINGVHVTSALSVSDAVAKSGGAPLSLTVRRGGETLCLTLTPVKSVSDGRYKAGLWLKDSTAGVGTVTYTVPETGEFAGLGHGICDADTGEVLPLSRGVVLSVNVNGIKRGLPGSPGELRASFEGDKIGTLVGNSDTGVYGLLSTPPNAETVELGKRECVHEGEARIISTLDNTGPCEYTVTISEIDRAGKGSKNFIVTVTDKRLLEKTGGIVQGMSGSPILQDGKLIGAVTHVLVSDPARGYGIFIENMLSEAEKNK